MRSRTASVLLALLALTLGLPSARAQSWVTLTSGIDSNLRGISAAKIAATGHIAIWASGSHDVILRSVDDGTTWTRLSIPGQPELDFRGIVAFDDKIAYLVSSGEGNNSKIHKTIDGGINWELQYTDLNSAFFLDSIACSSPTNCFARRSHQRKIPVAANHRWSSLESFASAGSSTALPKEGAFAASNSNLLVIPKANCLLSPELSLLASCTPATAENLDRVRAPIAADNATSGIFPSRVRALKPPRGRWRLRESGCGFAALPLLRGPIENVAVPCATARWLPLGGRFYGRPGASRGRSQRFRFLRGCRPALETFHRTVAECSVHS